MDIWGTVGYMAQPMMSTFLHYPQLGYNGFWGIGFPCTTPFFLVYNFFFFVFSCHFLMLDMTGADLARCTSDRLVHV